MITPSHLIYSWALAKKTANNPVNPAEKHRVAAFILGALLLDIPVYVFFLVCGVMLDYGHETLWDDMYFNSGWSVVFTLSHSLLLWPTVLVVARWRQWLFLKWLSISALFHIVVDFCVHTADAYKHFWPLSDWRFVSPISYWDRASYGDYVNAFDSILIVSLLAWLLTTYPRSNIRFLIFGLLALAFARLIMSLLFFTHA
ncbi:MAG: hypothetical protein RLZZ360_552 [Candidatus Parcubacteria bacterium]|jgi:hypothetical protein